MSLTAEVINWTNPDEPEFIEIPVRVDYRVCSETVCFLPEPGLQPVKIPVSALLIRGARRQQGSPRIEAR